MKTIELVGIPVVDGHRLQVLDGTQIVSKFIYNSWKSFHKTDRKTTDGLEIFEYKGATDHAR